MARETIKQWKDKCLDLEKELALTKRKLTKAWHKISSLQEGHAKIYNKYEIEQLRRNFDDTSGELRAIKNQLRLSLKDREDLLTVIKVLAKTNDIEEQ